MGFWYFLLLLIGIVFIIVGLMKKGVPTAVKVVILLFVFGVLFIVISVFMFLPGSSEIIAELLQLDWWCFIFKANERSCGIRTAL